MLSLGLALSSRAILGGAGPSYSAESKAYFARWASPPSTRDGVAFNKFISFLVSRGVWSKLDCLYTGCAPDETTSHLNLISTPFTLVKHGTVAFSAYNGWTGNGVSGSYLDSTFNPTTATTPKFTQNSASLFAYMLVDNASGKAIVGNSNARLNPTTSIRINSASTDTTSIDGPKNVLWVLSRSGAAAYSVYQNLLDTADATTASAAPSNEPLCVCGDGPTDGDFSADQIGLAGWGSNLTQFDVAVLRTAAKQLFFDLTVSGVTRPKPSLRVSSGAIPATVLGMQYQAATGDAFPTVPMGVLGKGFLVGWAAIELSAGVYTWPALDAFASVATAHGLQFLYCSDGKPSFYTFPTNHTAYSNFITALVTRYSGVITHYGLWNEPSQDAALPSAAELAALANIAVPIIRAIDPAAKICAPGFQGQIATAAQFSDDYYAAGGPTTVDIVALHTYNTDLPETTSGISRNSLARLYRLIEKYGLQDKPIWQDEFGTGQTTGGYTQDQLTAFMTRGIILFYCSNVDTVLVYYWDNANFSFDLWSGSALNTSGIAYGEVHKWLVGSSISGIISQSGSVYQVPLTRPGGYQALIVWDAGTTGFNGSSSFTVPAWATQYHDLAAGKTTGLGATVTIGPKPLIFENQDATGWV